MVKPSAFAGDLFSSRGDVFSQAHAHVSVTYPREDAMLGKAAFGVVLMSAAVFPADGPFAIDLSRYFALPARPNALVLVQVDTPKTEAILRKTIQDLQEGKPDFSTMEPELQKAIKEQAQHTADIYRHLGALQSLRYIGTQSGNDIYRAVYQNAAVTYTIRLSSSGKISLLLLQPAFPWE